MSGVLIVRQEGVGWALEPFTQFAPRTGSASGLKAQPALACVCQTKRWSKRGEPSPKPPDGDVIQSEA
jgi:hypothetical protein